MLFPLFLVEFCEHWAIITDKVYDDGTMGKCYVTPIVPDVVGPSFYAPYRLLHSCVLLVCQYPCEPYSWPCVMELQLGSLLTAKC